jgi:hypothetical protein
MPLAAATQHRLDQRHKSLGTCAWSPTNDLTGQMNDISVMLMANKRQYSDSIP